MVHPDKCSHPQAQQAFVKLNKAFKDLQDPDKVSAVSVLVTKLVSSYSGRILCLERRNHIND